MTHTQKRILIMGLIDPSTDPRPSRAVSLARELGFEVHVAGFSPKKDIHLDGFYEVARPSPNMLIRIAKKLFNIFSAAIPSLKHFVALNNFFQNISSLKNHLSEKIFDVILVEDLYFLPVAHEIKGNAKVIFDAREYYPEQAGHSLIWRLSERRNRIRICAAYLPRCDSIITVSPGLADAYKNTFGVDCTLVRSVPHYKDFPPSKTGTSIRMVHHGVALSNRKLENMIETFRYLDDRFELDFYLVGRPSYVKKLQKISAPYPRIRFKAPVPFEDIGRMLSAYDLGFCLLEATTFNLRHSLPNKFFECVQSSLGVIIGPSPDMRSLVNQYQCGLATETFQPKEIASKLNALKASDLDRYKANSNAASKELCWEQEKGKLAAILSSNPTQAKSL